MSVGDIAPGKRELKGQGPVGGIVSRNDGRRAEQGVYALPGVQQCGNGDEAVPA